MFETSQTFLKCISQANPPLRIILQITRFGRVSNLRLASTQSELDCPITRDPPLRIMLLDIEKEIHHITVLHDVFFSFGAEPAF